MDIIEMISKLGNFDDLVRVVFMLILLKSDINYPGGKK